MRSATIGRDAQGEASLEIEHDGRSYRGLGVSTDTVEATVKALLNAVNRIAVMKHAPIRNDRRRMTRANDDRPTNDQIMARQSAAATGYTDRGAALWASAARGSRITGLSRGDS